MKTRFRKRKLVLADSLLPLQQKVMHMTTQPKMAHATAPTKTHQLQPHMLATLDQPSWREAPASTSNGERERERESQFLATSDLRRGASAETAQPVNLDHGLRQT